MDKYRDIIVDALRKDGKVIIDEGKKIVIQIVNDVVKVIVDGIESVSGKVTFEEENSFRDRK